MKVFASSKLVAGTNLAQNATSVRNTALTYQNFYPNQAQKNRCYVSITESLLIEKMHRVKVFNNR